jgi:hypothetical protein
MLRRCFSLTIELSRSRTNLGVPDGSYLVAKKGAVFRKRFLTI